MTNFNSVYNNNNSKKWRVLMRIGIQGREITKYNNVIKSLIDRFTSVALFKDYTNIIDSCLASLIIDEILIDYTRIDSIDNACFNKSNRFMGMRSTFTLQWHPRIGPDVVKVIVLSRDFKYGNYVINGFGSNFNENNISTKGYHMEDIHAFNMTRIVNIPAMESLNELNKFFDWNHKLNINSTMTINDPITWDTFANTILSWIF